MVVNDKPLQKRLNEAEVEIQDLQKKLDETNQQMEATLNALPDLLLEVDIEGRIHNYHANEIDTLFTAPDKFLGEKISKVLPEEAAQKFMAALHEASEHGYAVGEPYQLETPAGLIWREPSISTQRSEGQATGRFIALIRIVDDRMKRLAELNALAEIGKGLRRTRSSVEAGQTVIRQLEEILQLEASALTLQDPKTKEQVITVAGGKWEQATGDRLAQGKGITAKVIASREIYMENEFSAEKGRGQTHLDLMSQVSALICVPLLAEGVVIGTLWAGRDKNFDENDVNLVRSISETVASAVRKTQLQEETWENLKRLSSLRIIDEAISSSLNLQEVLGTILKQVTTRLEVDAVRILLVDKDSQTLDYAASRGFKSDWVERVSLKSGEGYAGQAALQKNTIAVPELKSTDSVMVESELIDGEGFASMFVAPLLSKDTMIGVLEIFLHTAKSADSDWLSFFETMAGQTAIALENAKLYSDLQANQVELEKSYDATLRGWVQALDLRDNETEGHSQRVTDLTLDIAIAWGISSEEELISIARGALLHDIGKIGIPDRILLKPGPLDEEEWKMMKRHPEFARTMLEGIAHLESAMVIPYSHHEKWDGSGYPLGLKGEKIPVAARLFALADTWDALTSNRPYHKAMSKKSALEYIQENKGTHFDPKITEVFIKLIES